MAMDVVPNLREEALKRAIDGFAALISISGRIKLEGENLQRFAQYMTRVRDLLLLLQSKQATAVAASAAAEFPAGSIVVLLQRMEAEVEKARLVLAEYNTGNWLLRPFSSYSVLSKLKQSSKEISAILQLLPLTHINAALNVKAIVGNLIRGLESMECKLASNSDAVVSGIDSYISDRGKMDVEENVSEVPRNDAFQFALILQNANLRTSFDETAMPPDSFFFCPLTGKLLDDPVSLPCGHSFERRAIEDHFDKGENQCPFCGISSAGKLELTPNPSLRRSIDEWKERNAQNMIRRAAARIAADDMESTNKDLVLLQSLMEEIPSCISVATESSCELVPKLANLLKNSVANNNAVLRCLLLIVRCSDENKEIIGKTGVIKCLLNQGKVEPDALEILLELSKNCVVANKIVESTDSIPTIITLLDDPNPALAERASSLLASISTNFKFPITMAKLWRFGPFLDLFGGQGISEERRASMAKELAQIQLTDSAARNLDSDQLVSNLIEMLSCRLPFSKSASLQCIKRLITFDNLRNRFLSDERFIPSLLHLTAETVPEQLDCRMKALEIFIFLVEHQSSHGLPELCSCNSIQSLLELIKTSINPEDQVSLLQLLQLMVKKSDVARYWIKLDQSVIFSLLDRKQENKVRLPALKLIYDITGDHPIGFDPSPSLVDSIVSILTDSFNKEEKSAALGIISHLPTDDQSINEKLWNSAVLKVICKLISDSSNSNELLENALGALLHCLELSNSQVQIQISKLHILLVQVLSSGSPLAKKRAAMILAHLARFTVNPSSTPLAELKHYFQRKKRLVNECPVHGSRSSMKSSICLIRVGAVRPLVEMVSTMDSIGSAEALMALFSLFESSCGFDAAASAIVESGGAAVILKVLERGEPLVKERALELFEKIWRHPDIKTEELEKARVILIHLLKEERLKNKANLLLEELF